MVYGATRVKVAETVQPREASVKITGDKLSEDRQASKLVIEKLQAEVDELKLRAAPSMDTVQEQL